jgi:hypothetical protein
MVFSLFTRSSKSNKANELPVVDSNSLKVIKDIVKGNRAKFDNRNLDANRNIDINPISDYKYQSPKPPEKSMNSNSSSVRAPRPAYDNSYSPLSFQYQESRYSDEHKQQSDDYMKTPNKRGASKASKSAYTSKSPSSVSKNKTKSKIDTKNGISLDFNINANLTTMIAAWKIKYFVTLIQKKTIKLDAQKQLRFLNRELDKRTAQLNTINGK